jgi:hypothetical protein
VTEESNDTREKGPALRASWRLPAPPQEDNDYAKGYEDGVRNALRDLVANVSKGYSAPELRFLAESRLAHLEEETMERRKSQGVSPRRLSMDSLIPVSTQSGYTSREKATTPVMQGFSYLFQEKSPNQAREFLSQVLSSGLPVVAMTRLPQELVPLRSRGKLMVLRIDSGGVEEGKAVDSSGTLNIDASIQSLTGTVKRFQEEAGNQIGTYLDAFDYLESEYNYENALRFVHWLNTIAQQFRGILIVSANTDGMEKREQATLQSDFNIKR